MTYRRVMSHTDFADVMFNMNITTINQLRLHMKVANAISTNMTTILN